MPPDRVCVYVDGFNLYFGMKSKGWRQFYWLDLWKLSQNMLLAGQTLEAVAYFTARISGPNSKRARQGALLDAYEEIGQCAMHYGHYQTDPRQCPGCGQTVPFPNEKRTDVSIAVELMTDALRDRFDTALIISGDSDLCPAIKRVRELYPTKRVVVAFPPNRVSNNLRDEANATTHISRAKLARSQMPDPVLRAKGFAIRRPADWV